MKTNQTFNKLQALNNAASDLNLAVHPKHQEDKRKKTDIFFVQRGRETVSPVMDYDKTNMFLLGWRQAAGHI